MKCLFIALITLCGLFACSSDDAPNLIIPNGLYVASDGVQMLGVHITNGKCTELTIYQKDGNQYVNNEFVTNGDWPKYEYIHDSLDESFIMSVSFFSNADGFTADYSGKLTGRAIGYGQQTVTFSLDGKKQKFMLATEPIDKNGDGIPDVLQNL